MDLRLNLNDTDFDTLAEAARAMIPALAPEWTDHNIHDPGIMLTELIAWVAEAQIYSLSRTRRDERIAYARLLGIRPQGPRPAQGLIWQLEEDERTGPAIVGVSVSNGAPVQADLPELPAFRLRADQHLSPAILRRVVTYSADGSSADNTRINRRNGATYLPFGSSPDPGDRLVLSFDGLAIAPGGNGAFGLGVEMSELDLTDAADEAGGAWLDVAMRDGSGERPLRLLQDTTHGFTRNGVLLLDIAPGEQVRAPGTDPWFDVILRPRRAGFLRLPRVRRFASNVLQVEQQESVVEDVPEFGQGRPGQTYSLGRVGRTSAPELSVVVGTEQWLPVDDLGGCDPHEGRFELNPANGQLRFGNGVNGRLVAPGTPLHVAYEVSAGTFGNAPPGIGWSVRGAAAVFGRNSQPFFGGKDATQFNDLQAQARRNLAVRVTHVTPADLEAAAKALAGLHVVRAHELPAQSCDLAGTRTLLAMAAAQPGLDPKLPPENPLWRNAVRARLSPDLLAGQRLVVIGPRYVRVGIRAKLQITAFADPGEVQVAARKALSRKFMDAETGDPIWRLGRGITNLMLKGWLRKVPDVLGVAEVTILRDDVAQEKDLALSHIELPRLDVKDIVISIERLARGTSPRGTLQ
jgi:hypothetical protein